VAKTHDETTPLRFRGSPNAIEAFVPTPPHDAGWRALSADLEIAWGESRNPPIELHPIPGGTTATRLRLVLPKSTPPGTYKGTLRLGQSRYPMLAEVEPYPHLQLSPSRLSFEAGPGSELEAELNLANGGNVACQVGKGYALGLFDQDGLNRATAAAFMDETAQGSDRTSRLMDEFAAGYGGIVRMRVEEGAGHVTPGELRNLRLKLRFPDRLKPGRSYFGTWKFHNLAFQVTVRVPGPKGGEEVQ
jgi:hypothetical protein